ncbi:hypothetical protein QCA50_003936 [Cerrena zonata]|uniref:Uncharacterized protein n=1 Tax=Cerrena zonata TaxID=2478898 RepID=A0AAW0GRX7_9APHY
MYKRGTVVEKTTRPKEKTSDVPGSGTSHPDAKSTGTKATTNVKAAGDRYALLQRKVEDLERLYAEGKKTHAAEVDRLKSDLARTQKTNNEHAERTEKLKKQNELLDNRVQELKKSNDSSQAEIKDLRAKLRVSEHERNQLTSKQGDLNETKKALQALDSKRRDELRERDRKIAELDKSLASEKKKRELAESKLSGINTKASSELQATKDALKSLEAELHVAQAETRKAKDSLATLQAQTEDSEEELLAQLEQHRCMLSRVADEYGRLASSTISKAKYDKVRSENNLKQLRIIRLERKLANTEGQVTELAHFIRTTKDESTFLSQRLREAEYEALLYSSLLREARDEFPLPDHAVHEELASRRLEFEDIRLQSQQVINDDLASWADFHRLRTNLLLLHASSLIRHVDDRESQLRTQSDKVASFERQQNVLQDNFSKLQTEKETFSSQLAESATALAIAQGETFHLKKQLSEVQTSTKAELEKARNTVAQEKQVAQKLAVTAQEAQAAEAALMDEIEQLTVDLAEAERYQEAYANLIEEVDALIRRNALAEEETERVSKFNAEILGHTNPAQKIMYVDRIRRELFETKQKLLMTNRDRDAVISENEALLHELTMYKSVTVHPDDKPRTTITRVTRIPLGTHNTNVNAKSISSSKSTGLDDQYLPSLPEMDYSEGDMTIDELS